MVVAEHSEPKKTSAVRRLTPVVLTGLFWAFSWGVLSGRDYLSEAGLSQAVAVTRALVAVIGGGLCYLLHLVIRRLAGRPFHWRALVLVVLAPIAADVFAWINASVLELAGAASPVPPTTAAILSNVLYWNWFFLAWSALYLSFVYSEEVYDQQRRSAEAKALAHAAQLLALRYQINPHFLFNTLNSISALIIDGRTDAADKMVARLAEFFRSSLAADPLKDVALMDEIELQELYLKIEQVRFGDLAVIIDIAEDVRDARVPSHLLQPLVENAVKHGVVMSDQPARIAIQGAALDGQLELTISNSGSAARQALSTAGSGVGLRNVGERLRNLFGDAQKLETRFLPDGGFAVHIVMPLRRNA